jgi:hypothetical protein
MPDRKDRLLTRAVRSERRQTLRAATVRERCLAGFNRRKLLDKTVNRRQYSMQSTMGIRDGQLQNRYSSNQIPPPRKLRSPPNHTKKYIKENMSCVVAGSW